MAYEFSGWFRADVAEADGHGPVEDPAAYG